MTNDDLDWDRYVLPSVRRVDHRRRRDVHRADHLGVHRDVGHQNRETVCDCDRVRP